MVTKWGLSEKLGPLAYAEEEGEVFLGRSVTQTKSVSESTSRAIDEEVRAVIDRNYQRAKKILKENEDILHAMADALMTYETIDKYQLDDLLERRTPVREPQGWGDDATPPKGDVKADAGKDDQDVEPPVGEGTAGQHS
jgi:cell division protease FtsH